MKKMLTIFLSTISASVLAFETSGWPGEGVPVISFNSESVIFCETARFDDHCKSKSVIKEIKMSFDDRKYIKESKVITVKPISMIALSDFVLTSYNLPIKKGTKLVNYQYSAEGYYTVGIKDKTYEVDIYRYKKYLANYDKKPEAEFWVNVAGKGWLKLPNDNVIFHDRRF